MLSKLSKYKKRNTQPRFNQTQKSRYNYSKTKSKSKSNSIKIKSKISKQNSIRKTINSNYKLKKYKEEITLLKSNLDKIKDETYKLHNISKTQLNTAWKKALMNYRRGRYINASKYFLICLLIGMIMLDRHGAYKKSYQTSTSLSNPNAQNLMCGLLSYYDNPKKSVFNHKNPVFNHKKIAKRNTNRIIGPGNYFIKLLKEEDILLDGFDESSAEKIFDLFYNCRNPYVQSAFTLFKKK